MCCVLWLGKSIAGRGWKFIWEKFKANDAQSYPFWTISRTEDLKIQNCSIFCACVTFEFLNGKTKKSQAISKCFKLSKGAIPNITNLNVSSKSIFKILIFVVLRSLLKFAFDELIEIQINKKYSLNRVIFIF